MSKNQNMTQGSPMKLIFFFALPLMFGNIFQQLYTVVDVAIIGRGVGMTALAAVGTVDWMNWMMISIAQGFSQGFSVRMSQKYGEGDLKGLKRIIGQSAILMFVIGILCTLLIQAGLPIMLMLLRVPEDLKEMATLYTRVLMAGYIVVCFYNFCAAVLRAVGNSKTPLIAMIIASITNILLDCVAVFVLGWGIAGAAAATVFAQLLAGTICAVKIWKTPELRFSREDLKLHKAISWDLIKIGNPMALKNIIISIGGMTVQSIVNGFGMSFIAGFTATGKLYGLLEIAAISYGYAVTTYVGQNYGAKLSERIRKGVSAAALISVMTSVVIGACMLIFGRPITMLFISSDVPELMKAAGDTAYMYLAVMASFLPILYLLYVYMSALQGMGDTVTPMIAGIIEFVMRVGFAIVVGITAHANGIFWAEVAAWSGSMAYMLFVYYKKVRKLLV